MTLKERYTKALESFTDQVKEDPNVVALLLSGSLAYGTVWEKSDIDLNLLVRDGSIPKHSNYSIDEEGIEIHVIVIETRIFKNEIKRLRAGEFTHGYYGRSTIVFTKDPSLFTIFEENKAVGMEDAVISCLPSVQFLLTNMNRAEKWVTVFHDPMYAQHFLQWVAQTAAEIIVLLHGEDTDREVILRASELKPELMERIYCRPCSGMMTEEEVHEHIAFLHGFLKERLTVLSAPILRYLSDHEVRTASEFANYFGHDIVTTLDYIAENGLIERVTKPSRLFKHSRLTVEEVAFFSI